MAIKLATLTKCNKLEWISERNERGLTVIHVPYKLVQVSAYRL